MLYINFSKTETAEVSFHPKTKMWGVKVEDMEGLEIYYGIDAFRANHIEVFSYDEEFMGTFEIMSS